MTFNISDIRNTNAFNIHRKIYDCLFPPDDRKVVEATQLSISPKRSVIAFTGVVLDEQTKERKTKICLCDLTSNTYRVLFPGPLAERSPVFSPSGDALAFLRDEKGNGDFQLFVYDLDTENITQAPRIEDGWAEYCRWSSTGSDILLGVTGAGADMASLHGARSGTREADSEPDWMPHIHTNTDQSKWRYVSVFSLSDKTLTPVRTPGVNVWEAVWSGKHGIIAICSDGPEETDWYNADLRRIDAHSGACVSIYRPQDQAGCLRLSPSQERVAFLEATSSDRGILAGGMRILDLSGQRTKNIPIDDVDVSSVEWINAEYLLFAGCRSTQVSIGVWNASSEEMQILWEDGEIGADVPNPAAWPLDDTGAACIAVTDGFKQGPQATRLAGGNAESVLSFNRQYEALIEHYLASTRHLNWTAPDNEVIEGILLLPKGAPPFPTIVEIHGGPAASWQPQNLGRRFHDLMLLKNGYALFWPNPRGSTGRGRVFANKVIGDPGGAEMDDVLFGVDALVAEGVSDPERLGVMGASHGGYLAAWLVTQDPRFAAAVALMPITNWISQHLTSNIAAFDQWLLKDAYTNSDGRYLSRSPVMFSRHVKTPVMNICGAKDRCTPAGQALEFYNALRESGVETTLVNYPLEAHGVRSRAATIDLATRIVAWYQYYMPSDDCASSTP